MTETKAIRIDLPMAKGQNEVDKYFEIVGWSLSHGPDQPVASLAEAVNAPLLAVVYCTLREHGPYRLWVKVISKDSATEDGTYGVNVMLAGATDFKPI